MWAEVFSWSPPDFEGFSRVLRFNRKAVLSACVASVSLVCESVVRKPGWKPKWRGGEEGPPLPKRVSRFLLFPHFSHDRKCLRLRKRFSFELFSFEQCRIGGSKGKKVMLRVALCLVCYLNNPKWLYPYPVFLCCPFAWWKPTQNCECRKLSVVRKNWRLKCNICLVILFDNNVKVSVLMW